MPDHVGRLTPQERIWVRYMAATNDATYAAEKAGYASPQPRGSQNLAKPALMELVREAAWKKLRTDGARIGVDVLISIAEDDKQPAGARRAAAADLVKLSGLAGPEGDQAKEPHEMTAEELAAAIDKLRRAAAARLGPGTNDAAPVLELERSESGVFD